MNMASPQIIDAATDPAFATLMRAWRRTRGMSQLSLALVSGVSARHVGFLEVGRSHPSRGMVLGLAEALDIPLRDRNQLLVAAGFAPMYNETPLIDDALASVRQALDFVLAASEPHPCFVVNRRYDVLLANRPGRWLLRTFTDNAALTTLGCNMVRLLTEPGGMAPFITNREDVLRKVMGRVRRELGSPHRRDAADEATWSCAERAWAQLPERLRPEAPPGPMIGLQLARGDLRLSLFTTLATLGTPLDITLQELRIETFFPHDTTTRAALAKACTEPA